MGILDLFKKKSNHVADNGALALDELPPIPSNPNASNLSESSDLGLPPSPSQGDLTQPVNSDAPAHEAFGSQEMPDLEVPDSQPVNNELFQKLNASLAEQNVGTGAPALDADGTQEQNETQYPDEVPSQEEVEEVMLAAKDEAQQSEEESDKLPGFADDADAQEEETPKDSWLDEDNSVDLRRESLLLKSIFVEREHYANLLFSLRTVKDDLQKSGPQQRKLSNIDMKLGKEYSKLSTLFENFNENVMIIEHIVSNEKF